MNLHGRRVLVTGGAGFIGSHLVDALLERGADVVVLDNLSTGRWENVSSHEGRDSFRFLRGDLFDVPLLKEALSGVEIVFHLAADPDVRGGPRRPLEQFRTNAEGTALLLEESRKASVGRFVFTSTSTVYGEAQTIPTPENYSPLHPISIYGAAKLAAESILCAYAHTYGIVGTSFRFGNVVGPRSGHGVIVDFIEKLRRNPQELEILGDGTQTKSYVSVKDTVDGILFGIEHQTLPYDVFNIASADSIPVTRVAEIVVEVLGLRSVRFRTTGGVDGGRGWKGDVKRMLLSIEKLCSLGWSPTRTSEEAVREAASALLSP